VQVFLCGLWAFTGWAPTDLLAQRLGPPRVFLAGLQVGPPSQTHIAILNINHLKLLKISNHPNRTIHNIKRVNITNQGRLALSAILLAISGTQCHLGAA